MPFKSGSVRPHMLLVVSVLLLSSLAYSDAPATMRLDYYHTGNATTELFGLDRVVIEPLPWPGDLAKTIDDSNLGNYFFEVHDIASGRVLYSRGFGSIFSEWSQTEEAKKLNRTFSESLRFPAPTAPVKIILKERKEGTEASFHEVWSTTVDPKDKFIDRVNPPSPGPLITIQKMGEPATKVDLLILGDGYTAAERGKFEQDARRATDILFSRSPFREHRQDFNVWGLCPPAEQSGISRPSTGVYRHSPAGASYDTFDSERYIMTTDNHALRDIASYAPYEFIEILANAKTYGGGGIFNLYATVAIDSEWAPYVFVHEFGHHFAGLADEYYTSDVSYVPATQRMEPWEPNVTALQDPAILKWKDLVAAGTPLPTPWHKAEFEAYEHEIQAERRRIAPKTGRKPRWTRYSKKRKSMRMSYWQRTSIQMQSARSRERTTSRTAITVHKRTASCSRATINFARSAGAASRRLLGCTRRRKNWTVGAGYISCWVKAPTLDLGY